MKPALGDFVSSVDPGCGDFLGGGGAPRARLLSHRSRPRARARVPAPLSTTTPLSTHPKAEAELQYTRCDSTPSASQSLPPAAAPIPHLTGDELLLQRREEAGDRQWRRGPHHPHARRHQPRARRLPRPRGQRQRLRRAPGVLHRRREEVYLSLSRRVMLTDWLYW